MSLNNPMWRDMVAKALGRAMPGAIWEIERREDAPLMRFHFRCRPGWFAIEESKLEDHRSGPKLILEAASTHYWGSHAADGPIDADPQLVCPSCACVFPTNSDAEMSPFDQFAYAERQANRWMERAQLLQRALEQLS